MKKQNHILYEYNSTLFAITFFTTRIINYSYYFFIKDDFNRKLELYNVGPYELGIINKYNIKRYNDNGKPLTYNKLTNKITDRENEKITYHKNRNYTIV